MRLKLLRTLRSAEILAFCWASPTSTALPAVEAMPAFRIDADDFAAFYSARSPPVAQWLRRLESLLRSAALPALRALEDEWRHAVGLPPASDQAAGSQPLAFRASVRRTGADSTPAGVTSGTWSSCWAACVRASWVGASPSSGLTSSWPPVERQPSGLLLPLRRRAALPSAEALVAVAACRRAARARRGLARLACSASRAIGAAAAAALVVAAAAAVAAAAWWCSTRASGGRPTHRGGPLMLPQPGATFIGFDVNEAQLAAARAAAQGQAAPRGRASSARTRRSCRCPTATSTPFWSTSCLGSATRARCPSRSSTPLPPRSCAASAGRVVMVALTTHKHLLSCVVRDEPRWQPVASDSALAAYRVRRRGEKRA